MTCEETVLIEQAICLKLKVLFGSILNISYIDRPMNRRILVEELNI